jgi:hypothetical protein
VPMVRLSPAHLFIHEIKKQNKGGLEGDNQLFQDSSIRKVDITRARRLVPSLHHQESDMRLAVNGSARWNNLDLLEHGHHELSLKENGVTMCFKSVKDIECHSSFVGCR